MVFAAGDAGEALEMQWKEEAERWTSAIRGLSSSSCSCAFVAVLGNEMAVILTKC